MTLIATFKTPKVPILFGDLLISGEERAGETFHFPGLGKINVIFPEGSGFTPIGLLQKICLLNDYLAVAWAGNKVKALSTVKELSRLTRPFTADRIAHFLTGVPKEEDVALICWCIDEKTKDLAIFGRGLYKTFPNKDFGEILAAGTGIEHLKSYLNLLGNLPFTSFSSPSPPSRGIEMIKNVTLLTSFLLRQGMNFKLNNEGSINHHNTFLHYFGGGFEVVYRRGGKLCKLQDICYVFWRVSLVSNNEIRISLELEIFYYTYYKDLMVINSLFTSTDHSQTNIGKIRRHEDSIQLGLVFRIKENSIYFIRPIHKIYSIKNIKGEIITFVQNELKNKFLSGLFCHHISIFKDEKGMPPIGLAFLIEKPHSPKLRLVQDKGNLKFGVRTDLLNQIYNLVLEQKYYHLNMPS